MHEFTAGREKIRFEEVWAVWRDLIERHGSRLRGLYLVYVITFMVVGSVLGALGIAGMFMEAEPIIWLVTLAQICSGFLLNLAVPAGMMGTIKRILLGEEDDADFGPSGIDEFQAAIGPALNAAPIALIVLIIATVGGIFLLIPGLVALMIFWPATYLVANERVSTGQALGLSYELFRANTDTIVKAFGAVLGALFAIAFMSGFVYGLSWAVGEFALVLGALVSSAIYILGFSFIWSFAGTLFVCLMHPELIARRRMENPVVQRRAPMAAPLAPAAPAAPAASHMAPRPVEPVVAANPAGADASDRLIKLQSLRAAGLISDEDFEAKKQAILQEL